MGPIRSPSGESARHEDAQKRLISATAAAQKRRVGGLAYESPAALRGWRSGEQAGTCSAVLGAAGESRERGRGWPPRAAKAKYRTILRRSERRAVSWLWGGGWLRGVGAPSCGPPVLAWWKEIAATQLGGSGAAAGPHKGASRGARDTRPIGATGAREVPPGGCIEGVWSSGPTGFPPYVASARVARPTPGGQRGARAWPEKPKGNERKRKRLEHSWARYLRSNNRS